MVFDASFLESMLVETWILIVVNCSADREHFDFGIPRGMCNIYVSFHLRIFVPFFCPRKNSSLDHKRSKERTISSQMKSWSDLKGLLWKLYCTCNELTGLTLSFDWVEHSPKWKHFKNHFYFSGFFFFFLRRFYFSILSLITITLLKRW